MIRSQLLPSGSVGDAGGFPQARPVGMTVEIARQDEEIRACFPVMVELRPHLDAEGFLARVRAQQEKGYTLACLRVQRDVVCVAGYRILENLAWGRFLYVDDFVTASSHRCKGYGRQLFGWLKFRARLQCRGQIRLDSGVQRSGAHAFYFARGMRIDCHHFSLAL